MYISIYSQQHNMIINQIKEIREIEIFIMMMFLIK